MAGVLIGNPKLVARAKALRKKGLSYAKIAERMRLRDNKAAHVLVNDFPGMDRTPKGTRGAAVAAKTVKTKARRRRRGGRSKAA